MNKEQTDLLTAFYATLPPQVRSHILGPFEARRRINERLSSARSTMLWEGE